MKVNTKVFGEIEIADEKIIEMDNGIIGFPDLNKFAIVFNSEREDASVAWFVSLDEPAFAKNFARKRRCNYTRDC